MTAIIVVVLLLLIVNPTGIWMPSPIAMLLIALLGAAVAVWVGLVWAESIRDEREALHRFIASRFGYVAGLIVLLVAAIAQSVNHALDPWIAFALGAMVVGKLIGLAHGRNRH